MHPSHIRQIQRCRLGHLLKRYQELFIERRNQTVMLLRAINDGVDIRTTDTWPKYQSIVDQLWIITQQIKAVQSCLMK